MPQNRVLAIGCTGGSSGHEKKQEGLNMTGLAGIIHQPRVCGELTEDWHTAPFMTYASGMDVLYGFVTAVYVCFAAGALL